MMALSVRQPHAEQIMRGEKAVEYRTFSTNKRGRVYIYASRTPDKRAFHEMDAQPGDFPVGVLVGTVEIVTCSGKNKSYRWELARAERLPVPLRPTGHPQPAWFRPFWPSPTGK